MLKRVVRAPVAALCPQPGGGGSATAVHRRSAIINYGFGTAPADGTEAAKLTGITIEDGDKVLIEIHAKFNGAPRTFATVSGSGGITFTQIGTPTAAANERVFSYYADTTGITSFDLTLTPNASTHLLGVHVFSVQDAAAGAPAASHHEIRAVTNQDPHDVDGGLSVPTNGVAVPSVFDYGGAYRPFAWTGATEASDGSDHSYGTSSAIQTVDGNATIRGQAGSGPSYCGLGICNTTWGP